MPIFKKFGILSVPVSVMMPIELFGHKPGQLAKGLAFYFFNFLFLTNCLLIFVVGIGYMTSHSTFKNITALFYPLFFYDNDKFCYFSL